MAITERARVDPDGGLILFPTMISWETIMMLDMSLPSASNKHLTMLPANQALGPMDFFSPSVDPRGLRSMRMRGDAALGVTSEK